MRSMTGYGRGQSGTNGTQFSVELNSVNRKQSDVAVTLPRDLAELEPRVRDLINSEVSRGRLNVVIACHAGPSAQKAAIDSGLARTYFQAMRELQAELGAGGEVSIDTVLRAPGVVRVPEEQISLAEAWPHIEAALKEALMNLVSMRELEGKNLAKDLIHRLKTVRECLRKIRELSHFTQFAHHLRKNEPVGRTLEFMAQEIARELTTLGSKANDVEISQLVVTCKAEMDKIREQIQNIE